MMMLLGVLVALCAFVHDAQSATAGIDWCYHETACGPANWATTVSPQFCNGSRQSPVNIADDRVTEDSNLGPFTFTNFNLNTALTKIENTGKTVKVTLASGVSVSGGGLPETYNSLQFHLHWGNLHTVGGSEHTHNGNHYPMELHIVNIRSSHGGNITTAAADGHGFAALGFFIDVMKGNETHSPASWNTLTSYLRNITEKGHSANITHSMTLDDLLTGVDRAKYYRYLGSLTTPACFEAVVWTVFEDPIRVSSDLIDLFSTTVRVGNSTSHLAVNTFRPIQPDQPITKPAKSSATSWLTGATLHITLAAFLAWKAF